MTIQLLSSGARFGFVALFAIAGARAFSAQLPPDNPNSSQPVERAVAKGRVLRTRTENLPNGTLLRTRLVRQPSEPEVVRVEEEWSVDSSGAPSICRRRDMFMADELIVKIRSGISDQKLEAALAALGMRLEEFIAPDICTVRLPSADLESVPRGVETLANLTELVEYSEPNGIGFGGATPNDPLFANQWGLHNTGQSGGVVDADVDGPEFWDAIMTAPGIVIAVLDSGLNFTHPDLQGIAWINPGEIAGDGLDNDGNGRIDDVNGWDFVNFDNNPTDDNAHGSNVSGIIAANRDNAVGIAGAVNGAKILVCKILNSSNSGSTANLIAAVSYARQLGVPIMNMSLQNYPFSVTLDNEFTACQTAGIFLSICAGNQGSNNDTTPNYPSSYTQTNILATGNHDRTDVRWSGSFNPSNYGATSVDLFAPGREILAPILGTSYDYYTGTSQAAPFVTAVAAAIKFLNPTWKATEIKNSILSSVVPVPSYNGLCVTGGRLNLINSIGHAVRQMPTADRDSDGFSNLFEYLAGTRLDLDASHPLITLAQESGYFRVKMARVPRPDAHLEVEQSSGLQSWGTGGVTNFGSPTLVDSGIPLSGLSGFLRIRAYPSP